MLNKILEGFRYTAIAVSIKNDALRRGNFLADRPPGKFL